MFAILPIWKLLNLLLWLRYKSLYLLRDFVLLQYYRVSTIMWVSAVIGIRPNGSLSNIDWLRRHVRNSTWHIKWVLWSYNCSCQFPLYFPVLHLRVLSRDQSLRHYIMHFEFSVYWRFKLRACLQCYLRIRHYYQKHWKWKCLFTSHSPSDSSWSWSNRLLRL